MRVGEYTARILVDGKELEEYEVTVDASETQATCWVASEVGKKFTVQWKCHFPTRLLESSGYVTLDGTECGGKYIRCGLLGKNDTANISSISCGTMERDFIFSSLQLSDDEALFGRAVSKQLGEISVKILHGAVGPPRYDMSELPSLLSHSDKKHEKMVKKLSSHCVGFGQQRTTQRRMVADFIPNSSPPIIFTFKYRPIAILQANGIAPRHEGAPPKDVTPENDTIARRERIRLLEDELKRLRDQAPDDTAEGPKAKRIKKEHGVSEKRPIISEEVIDLT
ncbi:hypothetical protein SCLCIDRAFT_7191 [Scleroderma citrinum Foug A]|uniref:DUF7918 domain-containing protein n=1 Tax=Scleroderma citrinum Foug A TaxID=1036808 RepID=A0A0C3EJW5_9AGAM|nr:hypothetical protein SCLCIDRAFT_7191 [Scleroderma citrinum Foug A]